ncbi:hypothetical protein ACMFMF_002636 [Clarireedia jacksonii]
MKPFRTTPRPEDIDDDNAPQLPGEGLINHRILTGRFPDDKYPYISRRATEVDGLEGMTPEKLFNVLVLNSRLSEDPRTCFDFLFNRDSEIVWYAETKSRQEEAWNNALIMVNPQKIGG